jgi:hypothetical protein
MGNFAQFFLPRVCAICGWSTCGRFELADFARIFKLRLCAIAELIQFPQGKVCGSFYAGFWLMGAGIARKCNFWSCIVHGIKCAFGHSYRSSSCPHRESTQILSVWQ